jgi:exonuclease III
MGGGTKAQTLGLLRRSPVSRLIPDKGFQLDAGRMKIISWNVNGIRAALKKGLAEFIAVEAPDVVCLQETRALPEEVELPGEFAGYETFWNPAEKRGYAGTAIFTKDNRSASWAASGWSTTTAKAASPRRSSRIFSL